MRYFFRSWLILFVILVGIFNIAPSHKLQNLLFASNSDLVNLTIKFHESLTKFDEESLNSILADEIEISHGQQKLDAKLLKKQEYISWLKNQMNCVSSIETINYSTSLENDDKGSVTCDVIIRFCSDDKYPVEHHGKYTHEYIKQQGEWKLSAINF